MKRKFFAFLLAAVTFAAVFLAVSGNEESIVICASSEQFRNDALREQLSAQFPEYNIVVMYMSTGKAAAKIAAEGTDTEVDILVGLETSYLSKLSGSLSDISGISTIPYLDGLAPADNGNLWITWERQAGAIIVNTDVLSRRGLEAPRSYEDLLAPAYRGLIAMPDPTSSGTGYFFYKNWVNIMGQEQALAYVDALHGNIKQFTESGSGPIKLLKQGEAAIGLALTFQAVEEIGSGYPLQIIYPETGSPYSLTGSAIIDGRREKEGVEEVFAFIANEFLVYDKENFSPEPIYENQINRIDGYPTDIPYADMTGIQSITEKERLLALWKY